MSKIRRIKDMSKSHYHYHIALSIPLPAPIIKKS